MSAKSTATKAAAKSTKPATKTKASAKSTTKPATKASTKATNGKSSSAKPATRPKTAAKAAAKPAKATKAAAKPATKAKAPPKAVESDPIEIVRPLIKVRQAREFTTKKVSKAELDAVTEVARWSGSSRNEQPCRFIAIRNQELIRQIADIGLPQTRGLPTATAAVAIIVPEEPERELSRAFDDGRAAERMLIAAHMLGLGGGVSRVRADVRAGINKALKLPANRSVRTIVGLGHPTEDALQPKTRPGQARLPREEVVYEECWPEPPVIE